MFSHYKNTNIRYKKHRERKAIKFKFENREKSLY